MTEHELLSEAQGDHISEKGISPELLALWEDVQKENESQSPNSQSKRDTKKAARRTEFNDNLWDKQWYMVSIIYIFLSSQGLFDINNTTMKFYK